MSVLSLRLAIAATVLIAWSVRPAPTQAEAGPRELAVQAQNPLPSLISVPIQNNFNFRYGPRQGLQDGLNFQPIVPAAVSTNFNIITRTVVPLIFNPSMTHEISAVAGLGDIQITPFLSPAPTGPWVWGIGPVIQLPTHSSRTLGNDNLGLGPSAAVLRWEPGSPWVLGGIAYTAWSLGTSPSAASYSIGYLQPLLTYVFEDGLYVTSSPILKADWLAAAGRQILLPLGGGVGKILHLGKVPMSVELSAYYNVAKRDYDADWQLRLQIQFLFSK